MRAVFKRFFEFLGVYVRWAVVLCCMAMSKCFEEERDAGGGGDSGVCRRTCSFAESGAFGHGRRGEGDRAQDDRVWQWSFERLLALNEHHRGRLLGYVSE